jgi:hypothetical protein
MSDTWITYVEKGPQQNLKSRSLPQLLRSLPQSLRSLPQSLRSLPQL